MAQLNLCIVPYHKHEDGTFAVKYRITNNASVAYITTEFNIGERQWNGGQVIRHPQATIINGKLFDRLNIYQELIDELDPPKNMTASQIKKHIEQYSNKNDNLIEYGERYVEKLKANKQLSYAKNMSYTIAYIKGMFGENIRMKHITHNSIETWEKFLFKQGQSSTTVNIRMTHLKALLNAAINEGLVEYKVFPFRKYRMPAKTVRDICISKEELEKLRDCDMSALPKNKCASKDSTKRLTVARDLFMLSFYCAGINLTDLYDADVTGDVLTFVRKKTAEKKQGEKQVSITIQPEARSIINKYLKDDGKFDFGYHYRDYEQFRSFVTKSLNRIGEMLNFEKRLMFYSARKTFCQFGYEIGVPLYILEYAIGQTIKDANNRPIFNYIKIMRKQADQAIRSVIDYSFSLEINE